MEYIPAASIITTVRDDGHFYPGSLRANLYRGCSHGCIYCDSRSDCYRIEDFDRVRAKANALELIDRELRSRRSAAIVTTGAMSDPYNPSEAELGLTRSALELLHRHGFGVGITTKSSLVTRDADVLGRMMEHSPAYVTFSITCLSDQLSLAVEPGAPPPSERFAALRALSKAGVYCGVWLNPVLPFLTDTVDNIAGIVRRAAECGARFVVCFYGMTLRAGNREYFYRGLDARFPGVKEKYARLYGNAYEISSPNACELHQAHVAECQRLGLAYEFGAIREGILDTVRNRQIGFWE